MKRFVMVLLWLSVQQMSITAWAYSGGTGEPNDPYQIATAEDLIALGQEPNDYNDCFILTADIDLSGYVFDRAVIASGGIQGRGYFEGTPFSGSFDGQQHVISHLQINGQDFLGLFGRCSSGAVISHLDLEAVDVNGRSLCWNVGGLVGENGGSITSSYSTGSVSGSFYVGGFVGGNYGTITSSFWDTESSGQTDSAGGTGLPTVQMLDINTFLEAGWDFVGETTNGTDNLWWMPEGGYPQLWWEQ